MIGSLRGRVVERCPSGEVTVEVAGVGYRVTVSPVAAASLGDGGSEVFLHVHHHVREDAQTLYGFATREERACFEALIGAHGVGPTLALAILSVHAPAALRQIVADEDAAALCLVPGVGKKTAARLLVELASRLEVVATGETEAQIPTAPVGAGALADVRAALAELGYSAEEIRSVLRDLPDDGDVSTLLRDALGRLAVPR